MKTQSSLVVGSLAFVSIAVVIAGCATSRALRDDQLKAQVKTEVKTELQPELKTAVKGETKFAGVQSFTDNEVFIDVQEIRKAETSAQLVAENVAMQLERRVAFRRAMKKALSTAMKFGAKGIRIRCSGRLGGSEMSRVETYREGRVPLHTLRADIEFGQHEARTKYGIIGVKCWVFKGEVLARRQRRPQIAGA